MNRSTPPHQDIADRAGDATVSEPVVLADGYRRFERFEAEVRWPGRSPQQQTREILRGGHVVAVLPIDLARQEVVLIRQFRLSCHLALGTGETVEIVAGRVEKGEDPAQAAMRECSEEIGIVPTRLIEIFRYMPTPGLTDEVITIFLGFVDTADVPAKAGAPAEAEYIEPFRVTIQQAIAALETRAVCNGVVLMALQWLALHRERLGSL